MGLRFVSGSACAVGMVLGAAACSGSHPDEATAAREENDAVHFPGELREPQGAAQNTSAPFGAHLEYFGGRVVSNIQVVQVLWGAGNYIPQVTSTDTPSMATFYQGVLNSPYVDWLSEYNTSTQSIGRGSFLTQATIFPSPANNGTVIDDTQIQAEL